MPKQCSKCGEGKGKKKFSTAAWQKPDGERVCRICSSVAAGGDPQLRPSVAPTGQSTRSRAEMGDRFTGKLHMQPEVGNLAVATGSRSVPGGSCPSHMTLYDTRALELLSAARRAECFSRHVVCGRRTGLRLVRSRIAGK